MVSLTQKLKSIVSKNKTKFQFFISRVLIFGIPSVSYLSISRLFQVIKKVPHCYFTERLPIITPPYKTSFFVFYVFIFKVLFEAIVNI